MLVVVLFAFELAVLIEFLLLGWTFSGCLLARVGFVVVFGNELPASGSMLDESSFFNEGLISSATVLPFSFLLLPLPLATKISQDS
jgi:hypothetical protein